MPAITVTHLTKCYGPTTAVDDVDFSIEENEIFGMLGPNGAGKSTTVECIIGLKKPTQGCIRVLGYDPIAQRKEIYQRIGVQLQETSYPDHVKVYEFCRLFSSCYQAPLSWETLLHELGLYEKRNSAVSKLSGGQRQRLSFLLALLPNPRVLFLDELTTGLDPQSRRAIWQTVKSLSRENRTVFLTTHYMEEAEFLCTKVCLINRGKLVRMDTADKIIAGCEMDHVVTITALAGGAERLGNIPGISRMEQQADALVIFGRGKKLLADIVGFLERENIEYGELSYKKPNLEDAFLKLTGTKIED
jgi:ABC-2 type transport system ATP-binding protein